MEKEGKIDLLSAPRVTTSSGTKAEVNEMVEIPYIEVTVEETGEGDTAKTTRKEEVKFKEAGVKLEVTPIVKPDGSIDIILHPKVTEVVDYFEYQPEEGITTTIPIMHTRETTTRVSVKDGTTIVIAGLMQNWMRYDLKKVPFLGDIPLMGALFRHKVKRKQKGDLVVFVTPRVITPKNSSRLSHQEMKAVREKQTLILDDTIAEGKKYLEAGYLKEAEKKFKEALKYAPLEKEKEIKELLKKTAEEEGRETVIEETAPQKRSSSNRESIFKKEKVKEFLEKNK
ncbi:MAG: type II and III secretion system protein [Caldiserica bacterium]|nr:type II and III secretion system protein [Caldisericota bacterium]